jgi:ComF family protein
MNLTGVAATTVNALFSVLLAPACAACGAVLETPLDGCVCRNCWESIPRILPPVCDMCGDPRREPGVCVTCQFQPRTVTKARAIGEYEGTLREIVHAMKYQHRYSIGRALAALLRDAGREILERTDCVVPVPLHRRRQRARGFNQAEEIARHLGPPVVRALCRSRHTPSQISLPAERRHANVEGAFRPARHLFARRDVAGARVALVDDVSTTGATLDACARILKDEGAEEVWALTAARVVTRVYERPSRAAAAAKTSSAI